MITKNKNQATKFMGHGCIMFDKQKAMQYNLTQYKTLTRHTILAWSLMSFLTAPLGNFIRMQIKGK